MKKFDFVIIGGGPAGIAAALTAAEHRQTVALIESNRLGGICLNAGCIPIKSLVISSKFLRRHNHAIDFGVHAGPVEGRIEDFVTRQKLVVSKSYMQMRHSLEQARVSIISGTARLLNERQVVVNYNNYEDLLEGRKIIIATGSLDRKLPQIPWDGVRILSSHDVINLNSAPPHLICVGGGYITCTLAQILNQLGTKITIIEKKTMLLPDFGMTASSFLMKVFDREGISMMLDTEVTRTSMDSQSVILELSNNQTIHAPKVLVNVGREPNTSEMGLDHLGISAKPFIKVDSRMETLIRGIFAVGDVNGRSFFAHSAIAQGRIAVINALGETAHFREEHVPVCVNSSPEIAKIGMTEHDATHSGHDVIAAKRPFSEVARALALGDLEGFVKIIADRKTHKILGGLIIGENAEELISIISVFVSQNLTLEQASSCIAAHPSYAEAIYDVIWALKSKC